MVSVLVLPTVWGSLISVKFHKNYLLIKRDIFELVLCSDPQHNTGRHLRQRRLLPLLQVESTEAGCMPLAFLAKKIEKSLANDLCKYGDFFFFNERSEP